VKHSPASNRTDLSIYNEATGFIVCSEAMIGRQISPDQPAWDAAVASGDLLPFELVQDDSFVIRVVLGDDLTSSERDEAIGSLTWKLRVPDGKLVVAGGIELVMEASGTDVGEYLSKYAQRLAVPAGAYTATLFAYVHGVNGENLLNQARGNRGEGVGAWFRRTRQGDLPVWVRSWCYADPREDRGHEDDWADEPTKRQRAKEDATTYVHFLLQLTPLDDASGSAARQLPTEQGFFSFDAYDVRLPEKCPIGILATDLKTRDEGEESDAEPAEPPVVKTVDVLARVRGRALAKITGGPVEQPIVRIGDVYRLAWLATDAADPEIRIELPPGDQYAPSLPEIGGTAVST
jgi:hypothetical protein